MQASPEKILRVHEQLVLRITWPDSREIDLPYRFLRGQCSCAQCVNELTGQRMVDASMIDPQVRAEELSLIGAYALKIRWSDGHDVGLYTWERLDELCRVVAAKDDQEPNTP